MVLGAAFNIFPSGSPWDQIFRETFIRVNIFGLLGPDGFQINLAGLIIVFIVGLAATAITERLVGDKPVKSPAGAVIFTLIGAYVFARFVNLPFETSIEGLPVYAALLGAIVFGVFYVLIRKQTSGSTAKKAA